VAADRCTPAVFPVGTHVVVRVPTTRLDGSPRPAGAVGTVTGSVGSVHAVRFPDGSTAELDRPDLELRKHDVTAYDESPRAGAELWNRVILRSIVGSRAFGLDTDGSDTDRRGVYLAPADALWSIAGVPEQLENDATQECYWELRKFLVLALKANPNVLECLWTPLVEHATDVGRELIAMRESFLSKLVYQTYSGYVMSQFKKLEQDLRTHGEIRWKHVMHLLRLLISGITALREARVPVDVGPHRERLLAVKRGEVSWSDADAWRLELHRAFDEAYSSTRLPDRPDFARADAFLIRVRRRDACEPS